MTERERRIWDAAYGAAFVRLYFDDYTFSHLWPNEARRAEISENAATVADEAVEEFRRAEAKGEE